VDPTDSALQEEDRRKVWRFCREKVGHRLRTADAFRQLLLPALQHPRIVGILDPHIIRRADGRLAIKESDEILPPRGLTGEHVRHPDREAPAYEERLPLVHVPFIEAAFDELRDAFRVGG